MTIKEAVISFIGGAADLYTLFVFIRVLATWLRYDIQMKFSSVISFTVRIVDPALRFVRRIFPFMAGSIDLSPVILVIFVMVVKNGLIFLVYKYFNI